MTDHDVVVATPPTSETATGSCQLAEELVDRARRGGRSVGPGGLLGELTKQILETGLEVEMDEHLGYSKHARAGRDGGNSRNGTRSKTVITEVGRSRSRCPGIVTAASNRRRCASAAPAARGRLDGDLARREGADDR